MVEDVVDVRPLVLGEAVFRSEGPLSRALELDHVAEAVGLAGDVGDEAADVGASGALDDQAELRERDVDEFEAVHADSPGLSFHGFAAPRQVVQSFAVFLQSRKHGRDLEDVPPKMFERSFQTGGGDVAPVLALGDVALGVESVRLAPEQRRRSVQFRALQVAFEVAAARADANDEHARRQRVQRAAVAYFNLRLALPVAFRLFRLGAPVALQRAP
mmetsp:Transcript_3669/g.11356  ORF Transcript_3669/g.11356 Transcript_3669/m.11356 type:complete len:216 (-) Transcript_3669:285-932(-)